MPQLGPMLAAAATAFKATAIGSFLTTTVLGKMIASTAMSLAVTALQMALTPRNVGQTGGISTDVTTSGSDKPRTFIVGTYATGGHAVMPPFVYDIDKDDNKYLTYVLNISDTRIDSVIKWIVDGMEYDLLPQRNPGDSGYHFDDQLGQSLNGRLSRRAWARVHRGNQTAADPFLLDFFNESNAQYSGQYKINAKFKMTGVSYAVTSFKWLGPDVDSDMKYSGLPDVRMVVRGLPLYDPRKDTTVGGSGTHRWGNVSTYEYSDNPIVIVYNILRGITLGPNEVYGLKTDERSLPLSRWFAAMNKCDEDGSTPAAANWYQDKKRYRAGMEISVDQEPLSVIEELLKSCGAIIAEVGGEYVVTVGAPSVSTAHITDDEVLVDQPKTFTLSESLSNTHNGVVAGYPDPRNLWEEQDAEPLYNAEWEAQDGGRRLVASLKFPAVPYPVQVRRLMRELAADNRRQRMHTIVLPATYLAINPTDTIAWTSQTNGYISKLFEVVAKAVDPQTLSVQLTIRERDPNDYDFDVVKDGRIPVIPPRTPVTVVIEGVRGFYAEAIAVQDTTGKNRRPAIRIGWSGEVSYSGLSYEVRLASNSTPVTAGEVNDLSKLSKVIHSGILPQTNYQVRARALKPMGGQTLWTDWISITTPAVYLGEEDFADGVKGLFEGAGIKAPSDIPNTSVPGAEVGELAWSRADNKFYRWDGTKWVDHLQEGLDEVLEETLTAQGLVPPKRVAVLPVTGSLGDLVILETNGKMYRWDGAAWVTGVKVEDIDGQIPGDRIDSLPVEKLSGQVTAEQIADDLRDLIDAQGQSASSDKAAAEAAAGIAVTAKDQSEAAASASVNSRDQAAVLADGAAQSAAAASADKVAAETARSQAQTSAIQAAQSKTDADGSASAAATSATVSASAKDAALEVLNTPRALIPQFPSPTLRNFMNNSTGLTPVADYGSDVDGAYVQRVSSNWYATLYQAPLVPISEDRVYRLTIKLKHSHAMTTFGRVYLGYADANRANLSALNFVINETVEPDVVKTISLTIGRKSGGLVTRVLQDSVWVAGASFVRLGLSHNSFASDIHTLKIYSFLIEDVTEADAAARQAQTAGVSANAAAGSASSAEASNTAASQAALAANTAKTEAETAGGQARTSANEAAQSKSDAAGSASIAQTQAELAATAKDQADVAANAAANSATTASTKANEAGVSATAANTSKLSAETQAGIATAKANEAVTSASGAAGSAIEASNFAQLAALATSSGMVRNPTFMNWTGAGAPNVSHLASGQGTIAKAVGKYGNAVRIAVTGTANYGPGIQLLNMNGGKNPAKVLLTIEVEIVSGNPNGMVLQTGWKVGSNTTWVHTRIGHRLTASGIQTFQIAVDRPAALASATVDDFLFQLRTSYNAGGGSYSVSEVLIHRVDALEVVAESYVDQQLKTKATLDGLAESSYVMRVKSGGAAAGFEMVAASNPKGAASAIRMSADEILLDGSVKARSLAAQSVGAEQIAARAMTARHFAVADFTNLVPDDQLQDGLSWSITNPNAAEFRDSSELAIKPQSLGYIRFSGGLSGGTFSRAHSGEFPVEGGEEFFCQGEAWRQTGSAPNSGITFHIQFKDGDGNWMVPDQRFYYRYLTAEGLQSGAQVQSGSFVAPANARSARIYMSMLAGTDGNWIAASPLVRRKFGGKMVIDGDLEARHIKFGTLTGGLMAATGIITKSGQIDDLVVTNAKVADLTLTAAKIGNNALYIPYRFTRADIQVTTASTESSKALILNHNITGFEGGAFSVSFNADMDFINDDDAFGGFELFVNDVSVQKSRYGMNAGGGSGGRANGCIPVIMDANSYGQASVNIKVRAWSFKHDNWTISHKNFWVRNIALTVSGARR